MKLIFLGLLLGQMSSASDLNFQKLVDLSAKNGTKMELEGITYSTLSVDIPAADNKSINHEYFSSVGAYAEGRFVADHVEVVSETWKSDAEKNWIIDQWIFLSDLSGHLGASAHRVITETESRTLISDVEMKPSDIEKDMTWKLEEALLEEKLLK